MTSPLLFWLLLAALYEWRVDAFVSRIPSGLQVSCVKGLPSGLLATTETKASVLDSTDTTQALAAVGATKEEMVQPLTNEPETETQKLMRQVKDAGVAGVISYALWELAFWFVSVPVVLFGYYEVTGHWPNLQNSDDLAKLGAEAFAFVNFARFAVPLRIGLALSTTGWIQENVVDRFTKDKNAEAMDNDSSTGTPEL
jgi:hypothetical protein